MSGIGPKRITAVATPMAQNDRQFWFGVGLLVVAGVLLFAPTALGGFAYELAAVAVLGLAGGAVLVGTSEGGRPV